ncbi:hypothetical protein K9M50_02710 [Patescibacteria group bacterium]|nr:hypothetical protein [Patescibacteria group bacterium]
MNNKNEQENIINWKIPEYDRPERNKTWYVIAIIVILAILTYSIITANYLFTIIMLMGSFMLFYYDRKEAPMIDFVLEEEGIMIGNKFYDYDELKNFSIVYKPKEDIKNLYITFSNNLRNRITIPLMDQDPLIVRRYILQYVDEDLERNHEPVSESIGKMLKLQ